MFSQIDWSECVSHLFSCFNLREFPAQEIATGAHFILSKEDVLRAQAQQKAQSAMAPQGQAGQ